MNENGTKRRDWVKNAAIVFLTVMLLLTFFSQTIMNYSLPEVATQYVQSGSITAKIRGSGTVESGDPYEVKVTETRKVASVAVRAGDTVQKGDILYYLEDKDSEELKAALDALEKAEKAYENALLNTNLTSSDIQEAESGVTIEEYRNRITVKQNAVKAAENAVKSAENEVTEAQKRVDEITERYEAFNTQIKIEDSRNDEGDSDEKHARDRARDAYNAAYDAWSKTRPGIAEELRVARESLDGLNAGYQQQIDAANAAGDTAKAEELKKQWNEDTNVIAAKQKVVDLENNLSSADKTVEDAKTAWDDAQKALEIKMAKDKTDIINGLRRQQAELEGEKTDAEKNLTDKKNAVTDRTKDLEDRQDELKDLNDQIERIFGQSGLQTLQEAIDKAQEEVDKLKEKTTGATITAPISGTVTKLNVTAGNSTSADTPVAVMQPEGKGYTLSFSVTNEQARRLSVGDKADLVNAWRYDDIDVTLSSIKPDNTDPGQKKLLTFDVTGSTVTAGQSLSLSVGQKSANYDLIVPNSAIREDNNGKFILIVESKSSPLGTRYTASRVDVEVIASDDTQSAISAALYGYEFVITTSTKPVEAGKLVRLASD